MLGSVDDLDNGESSWFPFFFGTELAELNKPHRVYYGNAQTVGKVNVYSLVISQFAIENGPFIVDLPIKDGDFP